MVNADKYVETLQVMCKLGGSIRWNICYGQQCRGFLKQSYNPIVS